MAFRVLEANDAKDVAQVLANDTARKILDLLTEKDMTESQIVKELKANASTVHYNMKALKKAGLIKDEAFHYSAKGREVIHYKLTEDHIVIAPRQSLGLAEKLQAFVPAVLVIVVFYALLMFSSGFLGSEMAATTQLDTMVEMVEYDEATPDSVSATSDVAPKSMSARNSEIENQPVMYCETEHPDFFDEYLPYILGMLVALLLTFLTMILVHYFKRN